MSATKHGAAGAAFLILIFGATPAAADEPPCNDPPAAQGLADDVAEATGVAWSDNGRSADDGPPNRDNWNMTPAARTVTEKKYEDGHERVVTTWGVRPPRRNVFYQQRHDFEGDPFDVQITYEQNRFTRRDRTYTTRYARINVDYRGEDDADQREIRWLVQIHNTTKPIRPRITVRQSVAKGKTDTGVTTIMVDVHGDGSYVFEVNHYTVYRNNWDPPLRLHSWDWDYNTRRSGFPAYRTVTVRDPDAIPNRNRRR